MQTVFPENGRYTLKSKALKKIEGTEVIVPANDKKTITASIDASDIDAAERDLQPKGYYLEGYTAFESLDGAENLSIPFVGFVHRRSEERRVGKECRSRWSPYH